MRRMREIEVERTVSEITQAAVYVCDKCGAESDPILPERDSFSPAYPKGWMQFFFEHTPAPGKMFVPLSLCYQCVSQSHQYLLLMRLWEEKTEKGA